MLVVLLFAVTLASVGHSESAVAQVVAGCPTVGTRGERELLHVPGFHGPHLPTDGGPDATADDRRCAHDRRADDGACDRSPDHAAAGHAAAGHAATGNAPAGHGSREDGSTRHGSAGHPATYRGADDSGPSVAIPNDADRVCLYGDIDNLGFGFPPGFDVFSGRTTGAHPFPMVTFQARRSRDRPDHGWIGHETRRRRICPNHPPLGNQTLVT